MKLLITGSSGLIGNRFYNNYKNSFSEVFCVTRSESCLPGAVNIDLSKNFEFNLEKADVVLHTAAQTSTYRAYTDPLAI